jgi:methylmalonyl-CoA mutase
MAVEHLLDEFPAVSTRLWEDAIHKDLKGADYAKKLIWQSPEGIAVKPYYRREDIEGLRIDQTPGNFPYLRGTRAAGGWRIREEIEAVEPEQASRDAQHALAAGAEEISFSRVTVGNASDLAMVLSNLQSAPVHFEHADEALAGLLCERLNERPNSQRISTGFDPLLNPEFAAATILNTPQALVPFTIHGECFEEAGANAIEEAAFTLAAGIDFLAEMDVRGVEVDRAADSVSFAFSIGASYFFQIAKLRAFRMLWARAIESFGGRPEARRAHIHARTSSWNKTVYDPHVNVLRTTTEAMSAALGGADSICVMPFDSCYKVPDEGSRRLARNTQLVLKHEALLAQVADAGAGSYYLESLTDVIARDAWKLMQQIEAEGGYRKARDAGKIDAALEASANVQESAVATRRRVFIGTNQYADAREKVLGRVDLLRITERARGAGAYEKLRLRTERHEAETGHIPRVLLAEFGDVKMRGARSTFATNFFACAGFEITVERFDDASEMAKVDTDLVVLCSSDAEYLAAAHDLFAEMKLRGREVPVLIAGNPETAEQLRAAGVADFIHVRSNPVEVLTNWQQRLGMKA